MTKEWFEGHSFSLFHDDEEAHERCYKRRIALVAAVALVALLLLTGCATTAPTSAQSKSPYDGPPMVLVDDKGNSIRLTKEPCPNVNGWLAMASADMVYQGKRYKACWLLIGEMVLVFDSNGDASAIPAHSFKRELGV